MALYKVYILHMQPKCMGCLTEDQIVLDRIGSRDGSGLCHITFPPHPMHYPDQHFVHNVVMTPHIVTNLTLTLTLTLNVIRNAVRIMHLTPSTGRLAPKIAGGLISQLNGFRALKWHLMPYSYNTLP